MNEEQISAMIKKEVAAWLSSQQGQTDGYQYEKTFVECWRSVGQKVLQESLGRIPGSKNKKKLQSSLGEIIVPNNHSINQMANNFRMTSYLQENVCFVGQKETFEEGSETLQKLMGIEVSNKQIQRVSEHYGQCLEEGIEQQLKEDAPHCILKQEDATPVYGMCDGSMVFTREEKWKEIKLGRFFKGTDNLAITEHRNWIEKSKYCALLGGHEAFLKRFELLLCGYLNIVFIADGARWFWDWASLWYPNATQILDYFHCKEYLCEFAQLVFKDKQQRDKWIKQQEDFLFSDNVSEVISTIKTFIGLNDNAAAYQQKIITYYQNNQTRMLYGTYKKKGLLIGSGPIESAHRNIIQKRLKLSGQRWGKPGVQQIANLRVAHKSDDWDKVVEMIKKAA